MSITRSNELTLDYATDRTMREQREIRGRITWRQVFALFGVVIVVVAVNVPHLFRRSRCTAENAVRSKIVLVAQAIERFEADVGSLPANLHDFVEPSRLGHAGAAWAGPYVSCEYDFADPWDRAIRYRCPGRFGPDGFDLWSAGPNGIDESSDGDDDDGDDIGNWQ